MKTTMFNILKERLEEEEIIKLVSNYDNKFCELEEENKRLNNIIKEAIEYLESYNTDFKNCKFGEAPISLRELGDLLDILRGEENDKTTN